ncbi:hypothetical protein POL68_21320 [Stigmatella sp. ncwal1]|uniref:BIG2 domain-containing protein n=1 Tax=Stigmatella ashevillensis TaxID=2995309 RepID=A0ABT5DBL7_9BACT|nr:hypothetical protein [Stigmatella ashevillena]MDC0711026.1 hypothetical protein [Stigmatella ashevillena]
MTPARISSIVLLAVAAVFLSCSEDGGEEAQGPSISVSPRAVNLGFRQQQRFTADIQGLDDTSVRWVVVEKDAGAIDDTGLYTASSVAGTYHVVAISVADPSRSSSATINVQAQPVPVSVRLTPIAPNVPAGTTLLFSAMVTGASNTTVLWRVTETDGGTIDATGLYTAPATEGTFHVVATSVADPSKSDTATVRVVVIPPIAVSLSPEAVDLVAGATQAFTAVVTGTSTTGVDWSVTEAGGGTIDAAGRYTAPATPGTYHVVATSAADPSKSATATVRVTAAETVAVTLSPTEALLAPGGTQAFTATVTGAADTAVNWSVTEAGGGTVDAAGLYTAPVTLGTYHVVATSAADPSKSATATVIVRPFSSTGLVMHVSAAQLLGPGGTLPAEGAPVSSWVDLSGSGHDLGQTEALRQPVFKANALNGLPAVSFDGNDTGGGDFLRTMAFTTALAQPLTLFFVYKAPPLSVNKTLLDAPPNTGSGRIRVQATTVPEGALQLYSTTFTSPVVKKTPGTFYYVTALFDGANSRLRSNGVEETPTNRNPGALGMGGLMLGGRQELTANAFAKTEFAEVLLFDRALSDADLGQVEAYLKNRYFPP